MAFFLEGLLTVSKTMMCHLFLSSPFLKKTLHQMSTGGANHAARDTPPTFPLRHTHTRKKNKKNKTSCCPTALCCVLAISGQAYCGLQVLLHSYIHEGYGRKSTARLRSFVVGRLFGYINNTHKQQISATVQHH